MKQGANAVRGFELGLVRGFIFSVSKTRLVSTSGNYVGSQRVEWITVETGGFGLILYQKDRHMAHSRLVTL